jgi:hypothetical protein
MCIRHGQSEKSYVGENPDGQFDIKGESGDEKTVICLHYRYF